MAEIPEWTERKVQIFACPVSGCVRRWTYYPEDDDLKELEDSYEFHYKVRHM